MLRAAGLDRLLFLLYFLTKLTVIDFLVAGYGSTFKKISLAVLLLTFLSWSHEGLVICYGADGHIEIERPSDKGCYKKSERPLQTSFSGQYGIDHCFDVPVGAQKYLASARHSSLLQYYVMPLGTGNALIPAGNTPCPLLPAFTAARPPNPQLAVLQTIVLLI